VIIEVSKDNHVELVKAISKYNIPLLGVGLNKMALSEKMLQMLG
jgi:hypothetical protein